MVRYYLAIALFAALIAAGCSSSGPVFPESQAPSGWVIEPGTASLREADPYIDVTGYALPAIDVEVDKYIPYDILELILTLVNTTEYTPRYLCIAFDCPMQSPDGMTDRGASSPWDFRFFNDGDTILKDVEYQVDIHLDISKCNLGFDYYIMGLFGPDPLNDKFVYEESNDWYDTGNHNIRLAKLNGSSVDSGLDGKWPMMSGNGRYIAAVQNPGIGSHFVIKDTWTGDTTEIHISIPGVSNTRAAWGVFDYHGRYFVYMGGQPQYREYLWLRDMDTGGTTIIEGAADGSEICAAFGVDISADGTLISYTYNDNPTDPNYYFNIRTYDIATGQKNQVTDNTNEECNTSLNYRGTRLAYRRGYKIPYGGVRGGEAATGMMHDYIAIRRGEIPDALMQRGCAVSYITVYELRTVDLITGEERVVAEKVEDPPNYITDACMDWAGNYVVYCDQPDQIYSTYTTVWAVDFDGAEKYQITDDDDHYKLSPFPSGDSLYGGWDVFMGSGGIWAFDRQKPWLAIGVGMWPDNGV